jgi:penicillin amidase
MLVADREGAIAWTLAGRLPQRRAYSGRLPVVHSLGDRGWDGFLPPELTPSLVYPKDGYLSSANERLFGGDRLAALGDGGYAAPARARQLRAGVAAAAERGSLAPADMLALQLDDRSLELQHWRDLLVTALSKPGAPSTDERRALLRLARTWDGRAGADSAGQLIARTFRRAVEKAVMEPLMEPCVEKFPGFRWTRFNSGPAIRKILEERPAHLLDPRFGSWEALLLQAADDTAAACAPLGEKTWADQNTAAIRHPLLRGLPRLLSSWADMPADPLSGDSDVPRVARPSFGASERFAVSPGRESEAYLHMPGGQSAHPLSPWFRAGHQAWVRGVAQPFLPGPAKATLVLKP